MADMNDMRQGIVGYFRSLTMSQRISLGGTVIFIALGMMLLFRWATKPDYALLYSNLDLKEADQIVESLRAQNIPYKLTSGGSSVLVPSKDVYEWRMKLASQGLPSSGNVGYEVFDNNDIGVSDFVQEVNYRRAIEGELSRTIIGISGIQNARVHIVMPKKRLFKEAQEKPTASIVLKMKNGVVLREEQIQGISHLVAASVEGLFPENVTVVDSQGKILSRQYDADPVLGLSSNQIDLQRKLEASLEQKAQSMLAAVLGEGKAVVRVSAQLNFKKVETTAERYDPDNTAVLSEERNDQNQTDTNGISKGQSENSVTNYLVPKTIEKTTNAVGDIQRLTVAVMVDGTRQMVTDETGAQSLQYQPRSEEELNQLRDIVRNAVGLDEINRGDQLEIRNVAFNVEDAFANEEISGNFFQDNQMWFSLAQRVAPVIGIVVLFLMLRSRLKKIKVSTPATAMVSGKPQVSKSAIEDITVPKIDQDVTPEAMESAKLLKQISEFAEEKPSLAARLVRYWMLEE